MKMTYLFLTIFSFQAYSYDFLTSHKTAGLEYPENTIEGFNYSLTLPVQAIEFDIHFTSDRRIVLSHDPVLDHYNCFRENQHRKVVIAQTSLKDLKKIHCYNKKLEKFYSLPSIEEILTSYKDSGRTDIQLNIELKVLDKLIENWSRYRGQNHSKFHIAFDEMTTLIYKKLRDYGISSNVMFTTFDRELLLKLKSRKKQNEEFQFGLLHKGKYAPLQLWLLAKVMGLSCHDSCWLPKWKETYKWLVDNEIDAFFPNWPQLNHKLYNRGFKKYFQRDGQRPFKIYPWTLNTEKSWDLAKTYDFDGVITDLPTLFLEQ